MKKKREELSYLGEWDALIPLLKGYPELVNAASEPSGYTSLHQAAWHGAGLEVIGQLLALGADRGLKTYKKDQTAQEIAQQRHPYRADLQYILQPRKCSISQLMRKVVADNPDLFSAYDGNQVLCDRLIWFFTSDFFPYSTADIETRFEAAYLAATGITLSTSRETTLYPAKHFELKAQTDFWQSRFLPALQRHIPQAHAIPLGAKWTVVSDLFDPPPNHWGLRGDLFLWIEMRQTLCHVEIPSTSEELAQTISSAFLALTGSRLERGQNAFIKRLGRGGMSSGMVSGQFWTAEFIPLLQQRAEWLHETWGR